MTTVQADTLQVRRVDTTIALYLEIPPEQLGPFDPEKPLVVIAVFEDNRSANRVRRALAKALDDAGAAKARTKEAKR